MNTISAYGGPPPEGSYMPQTAPAPSLPAFAPMPHDHDHLTGIPIALFAKAAYDAVVKRAEDAERERDEWRAHAQRSDEHLEKAKQRISAYENRIANRATGLAYEREAGLNAGRSEKAAELCAALDRSAALEAALAAATRDLERARPAVEPTAIIGGLVEDVRAMREGNAKLLRSMRAFAKVVGKPRKPTVKPKRKAKR